MIDNIIWEYLTYSHEKDKNWYHEVNAWAKDLGDIQTVAGVIAALSPNLSWPQNQKLTIKAITEGRATGALPLSCFRADEILSGNHPLDVLGGQKTRSFFFNIFDPTDNYTVTIDRHALAVVMGKKISDKEQKRLSSKKYYAEISGVYIGAAKQLDMIPSELQAATWCSWRERYQGKKIGNSN